LQLKYSMLYHLEGLPPLYLARRGRPRQTAAGAGELVPYSQSVTLAEALERRGLKIREVRKGKSAS